ncbi:MAG: carboxylating nicotinate-nucleotide diphosphorylase [bacterium]|nr:carboxylating nicotinate-nucleotide diphosphorylase [bacterium]
MTNAPGQLEITNLRALLAMAIAEDLGSGDITAEMLPENLQASGTILAREPLVLCGGVFLDEICQAYDPDLTVNGSASEGDELQTGEVIARISGPACSVMSCERVALNFLQHLSGIATLTGQYVRRVAGTGAEILDTRKTIPAWRALEKYAVRCAGGSNHRIGLYDAVLIKDNHLAALSVSGVEDPIAKLASMFPDIRASLDADNGFIEIEVDTLEQFDSALPLGADVIMLDNMSPELMCQAVARRDAAGLADKVALEASGGITLENVRQAAETGVERIALGAITHSARAVDIALDIEVTG